MDGKTKGSDSRFRFRDFLIILICLLGTAVSLNLFRLDLFRTINSQNEPPVGTITIKNNIVQRRMESRVLWDRLFAESPVYSGDLIRVADFSDATLHIDSNHLELFENTLIRIQRAPNSDGSYHIELDEGNLNLTTGTEGGSLVLLINGSRIEAGQGTTINASSGENGTVLSISEGTATIIQGEEKRELAAGTVITMDTEGIETPEPAAMALYPRPNARYLKETQDPFSVYFTWKRINLAPGEALYLEISENMNFAQIFRGFESPDTNAEVLLNEGLWHWRLSYRGKALCGGRFVIEQSGKPAAEAPAPEPPREQAQPAREPPPREPPVREPVQRPAATPAAQATPAASAPPPLLAEPGNRLPLTGSRIGIEEFRKQRNIVFSWSPVQEANAYVFVLYQQSASGRKELVRRTLENNTSWTLDNLGILDRGTFVWQVEAVARNRNGTVERRGRVGENSFTIDIPHPGSPELRIEEEAFSHGQ